MWRTYVESKKKEGDKKFSNIITVSLGKYEGLNSSEQQKDNTIEREIINQILSQVNPDKLPLSNYSFKTNTTLKQLWAKIVLNIMFVLSVIFGIILLLFRERVGNFLNQTFNSDVYIYAIMINVLFFIIPVIAVSKWIFETNFIKLTKLDLKYAEASFGDDKDDEGVFDKEIKEIVYILSTSGTQIVVFEDLDRFKSIEIYNKLKILNQLLNNHISTITKGRKRKIVKFVYMIRDAMFTFSDRTKFFDIIVPIVPVVTAKNSSLVLEEMFGEDENRPTDTLVSNISLYIDEMRILKNIVNEYNVYYEVLNIGNTKINLSRDELFAVIVFKNIFLTQFEALQRNEGYVLEVFDKIDELREKLKQQRTSEREIEDLENSSYKQILELVNVEIIDEIFKMGEKYPDLLENKYIDLIRFLIIEGLLNETYYFYLTHFENEQSVNDTKYIKSVLENKKENVLMQLSNPQIIITKLKDEHFSKVSILNKDMVEYCIVNGLNDKVVQITKSVLRYKNYQEYILVLKRLTKESLEKYIQILVEEKEINVEKLLETIYEENIEIYNKIRSIMRQDTNSE